MGLCTFNAINLGKGQKGGWCQDFDGSMQTTRRDVHSDKGNHEHPFAVKVELSEGPFRFQLERTFETHEHWPFKGSFASDERPFKADAGECFPEISTDGDVRDALEDFYTVTGPWCQFPYLETKHVTEGKGTTGD